MPVRAPAEPAARAKAASRKKEAKEDMLQVAEYGQIRDNPRAGTLTAHFPVHENCRRQRSCAAAKNLIANPGQGRPLGMLYAWLKKRNDFEDRSSHVFTCTPGRREREEGRQALQELPDSPGSVTMSVHGEQVNHSSQAKSA